MLVAADLARHSLHSRFLISSAAAGASIWRTVEMSRHNSMQVLSHSVQNSDLLKDHAGKDFLEACNLDVARYGFRSWRAGDQANLQPAQLSLDCNRSFIMNSHQAR